MLYCTFPAIIDSLLRLLPAFTLKTLSKFSLPCLLQLLRELFNARSESDIFNRVYVHIIFVKLFRFRCLRRVSIQALSQLHENETEMMHSNSIPFDSALISSNLHESSLNIIRCHIVSNPCHAMGYH